MYAYCFFLTNQEKSYYKYSLFVPNKLMIRFEILTTYSSESLAAETY